MLETLNQQHDDWAKSVRVRPNKPLAVKRKESAEIMLINDSDRKLVFKIRTTRVDDIKPDIGVGFLQAKDQAQILISYTDLPNARPFTEGDRITVLMHECPQDAKSATQYWNSNPQEETHRFVIPLKAPSSEASTVSSTSMTSESEEEADEESETNTEGSGTETGESTEE